MTLADPIAGALALILLSAAYGKITARHDFTLAVEAYELLPERLVPAFALAYPIAELVAGLLLLPPPTRPAGALLGALVVVAATGAVAVNLLRGRLVLDCGCGGLSGRQPISWWLVARNAVLVVAFLVLAAPAASGLAAIDPVGAVAGMVAVALLYAAADQLLANRLRMRKAHT
jgi:hypothetical protein